LFCVIHCSPSECQLSSSVGSAPHSFPNFQHPSHELLRENGFVWQVYNKYHTRCLKGICIGSLSLHLHYLLRVEAVNVSRWLSNWTLSYECFDAFCNPCETWTSSGTSQWSRSNICYFGHFNPFLID